MQKLFFLFLLFFSIAFWVSHNNQRTDSCCDDNYFEEYQDGVINHTISGPFAHRVMIPYAIDFLSRTCNVGSEKLITLYLNIILLLVIQFTFYYYLNIFFSEPESLMGTLWLALAVMMGFTSFTGVHVYETSDLCNLLFLSIALNLLYRGKWFWLSLVLFLSMINRETPAFILIPVYALLYKKRISVWNALLLSLCVMIPYLGLKILIHPPQPAWFLTLYLNENIPFYQSGNLQVVLFSWLKFTLLIGPALWLALVRWKTKNEFLRLMTLIVPVYIPVHIIVGHVDEYRLWVPLLLTLIPLALETLYSLFHEKSSQT